MTSLCIGGASYKGFTFLGALHYLDTKNYLSLLKNFYGTSIGAIIGIFYIIGIKPFDILQFFLNINLEDICDFDINNIINSYSIISNKFFIYVSNMFQKFENKNITIKEFIKKYEININIYAVSLKKKKIINFNTSEYENISVLDAIIASSSIPIIFPPVKFNNEYFVDACLKSIDGILDDISEGYTFRLYYDENDNNINNLTNYLTQLVYAGMTSHNIIKSNINTLDIELPNKFKTKFNFNDIKNSDKIELFYIGLVQAQSFYK